MNRRNMLVFALVAVGLQLACEAEDSAPLGIDQNENTVSLLAQIEGQYSGDWTIEILPRHPTLSVFGVCPGHVIIRRESVKERLLGSTFTGTYFIDAVSDCAGGSTVTGEVINGTLREDGGVNFGLDVPRSNGNFFEDVLAGSGVNFSPTEALGCGLVAADLNNHMDGSIVADRLRTANSAGLACAQNPDSLPPPAFAMRVSIDATK